MKTERGFQMFASEIKLKTGTLRVQESSLAFEGPHCWLFHDGVDRKEMSPQLSVEAATGLIVALAEFVSMAKAGNLMEKVEPTTTEKRTCEHGCEADELYLHSRCHPEEATHAVLEQAHGKRTTIRIECAKCEAFIARWPIADPPVMAEGPTIEYETR
jgi:hypothetical protein